MALQPPIPVACEVGLKRGGGEEENRVPPGGKKKGLFPFLPMTYSFQCLLRRLPTYGDHIGFKCTEVSSNILKKNFGKSLVLHHGPICANCRYQLKQDATERTLRRRGSGTD